jgi:(p)ppGpp synthase/HD superfamily hydrolase
VSTELTSRFREALELAYQLHATQRRKGDPGVPYLGHLLGVCSIVIEDGGSEDEAIAALLHDAVEDQGGARTLAEIRRRFGPHVASIVEQCSDTDHVPKPPWRARKEAYLAHLDAAGTPEAVLRVSAADKLHNACAILEDHRRYGDRLWERFTTRSAADQLWYYTALTRILRRRLPGQLSDRLAETVGALEDAVRGEPATPQQ